MSDLKKPSQDKPGDYRIKRRRRRRFANFKQNLFWAMIILLVALIIGAIVGTSSQLIERYYGSHDDGTASIPKDMTNKLKNLDIDKLLRERDKLRR